MKRAALFLSGDAPSENLIKSGDFADSLNVCCDGAYDYAKNFCRVDIVAGDFDSIQSPVEKGISVIRYEREKDYSDGMLGLKAAAEKGCAEIDIYGAFGGRIDHEYYNYQLLAYAHSLGVSARLIGEQTDVYFIAQNQEFNHKTEKGRIVSLAPFGDLVHILYTKGLKYNADDLVLPRTGKLSDGFVMGVSNVATDNFISVKVKQGYALVFLEK